MKEWKWYINYVRGFKWKWLAALVMFVLTGVILIGNTSIQKWLIDQVFLNKQFEMLPLLLTLLVAGVLVANLFHAAAGLMMANNDMRMRQTMTNDYKKVLIRTPASQILDGRTGDYVHTFMKEIPAATRYATHYIPGLFRHSIQVIVLSVIIAMASPWLLVILLAFSSIYIVVGKKTAPVIKQITKDRQQRHSEYMVQLEEGISSTREVIAFHRHEWELNRLRVAFQNYFQKVSEELRWKNIQLYFSEPIKWMPTVVVLGFGGYLVIEGSVSLGLFVIVFQFAQQFMESVNEAYHQIVGISQQQAQVERVYSRFHTHTSEMNEAKQKVDSQIVSLQFTDVTFRYDEAQSPVVDQLNLSLPIGCKIGVVGSSGSGKSTLAKLLVKDYSPQHGAIQVNGVDLTSIGSTSWFERLAYVSQEPFLLPDTIESNIRLGREEASWEEVERACETAQILSWIRSLPDGFATLCGERGIQLSGGQRQRIALARAVLQQKEILILDEATSALDQETERNLQHLLDKERGGMTTIVIAHRLSTVIDSDKIVVMEHGRLAGIGTHGELKQHCAEYIRLLQADSMLKDSQAG